MIEKNKDLLLKDLCARLPYGVKVNVIYSNKNASSFRQRVCVEGDNELNTDIIGLYQHNEIGIKPYLFPMLSMTKEQIKEFNSITQKCNTYTGKSILLTDFCNKHHIDWRGFIEKGLALDATGLNIY